MSYTDIAAVTELPLNTIKSHIFRAKKLLREYLKEDRAVFGYTHRGSSVPYPAVVSGRR